LGTTAIKHKFIGKPLKIQIFHTKNTPVHWGDFDPIKQEYSLVQRKKFIGMKTAFYTYQSHLHCIAWPKEKSRNRKRRNQKLATSLDFSWSCSLSAIRAMNSEARRLRFASGMGNQGKCREQNGSLLPCSWR